MSVKKKLLIQVGSLQHQDITVPVNTGNPVEVSTELGTFSVSVFIRNFEGSSKHKSNSLYNAFDKKYLDGTHVQDQSSTQSELPNLRILVKYIPNSNINGSNLFFGNECPVSVKDYVPATLMSTGLRLFKWFLNPTIESDLYGESPFIYGLALNSFSKLGTADVSAADFIRNENDSLEWNEQVPPLASIHERRKYFCNVDHSKKFNFEKSKSYYMMFDTNFLKLGDSSYNVSIPAFGKKTFDVNILRFANDKLDNINWTIKQSVNSSLREGIYGLVLNFRLVEESEPDE
ncbi:DUF1769-domain-containing protein [Metschnikowia bicuspidata var. bicuspidata NRRL YB-4993]|uniref:DUF1769-domain-containing protein n=1 Tax=Metschnikowia bicuspidata var. bicuspidata NRRL YB-4993 TaxID=869754 RepID=A0A1A0HGB1_9ASCO|nr:DUF1769-domain-containing protein [Metschnikowia bicuspidata var. bicuspidata NRRL YB-4993]OBA22917.1 DUF1769-domain-containing protein [Metschnikowia bicuspidata var. bicuspidata NRRL YB-4993]